MKKYIIEYVIKHLRSWRKIIGRLWSYNHNFISIIVVKVMEIMEKSGKHYSFGGYGHPP